MKKINLIFSLVILLAVMIRCSVPDGISQDLTFDKTTAPTAVAGVFNISTDNLGNVTITPSASGAGTYDVYFGDGTANPATVPYEGNIVHKYKEGNYTVKIVAKGLNGVNTEKTFPLSVVYRAPENLAVTLTPKAHNLKVKATALYAASFLVYFGDAGASEVGTPLAIGAEVSHNYATQGTYNVKVVALSGGAANTEKITSVVITDPFEFPITFESTTVKYSFVPIGGFTYFLTTNPKLIGNTTAKVARFNKLGSSVANSGTSSVLDSPIDFSVGKKIKVWAYNPSATNIGKKVTLELASADGGTPANGVAVLKVAFTSSGVWEEFVFDYGTILPAISSSAKFNQMIIRYNDTAPGRTGETFYLDEFRLTN